MEDRLIGRRYRITEKLGSGGMADVFKAKDEVLGRTIAVKVLHAKYAQEEGFVQRFRQEAQAAANLSHPNIVNIYDWGRESDDTYYIVMEYVRGTDLKSLIKREGRIDPRKAAEYAVQVCGALAAAHGYGVIHRDIKPHNIVLMPDETVKVMDFGIARAGDTTMTQTGSVLGTAQYVSPEQAQGRPLGPGSDLYSLGIVLYELTTGQLPFEADSPISVALKQVNEEPVPPRQLEPSIPATLEAIIMQAMRKDPAERYHAAEEMKSDLKRFVAGESLPAYSPPVSDVTQVLPSVEGQDEFDQFVSGAPRDVRRAPQKRNYTIPAIIVGALLFAALGVAWAMGAFSDDLFPVPSVVGMTSDEASSTIVAAGLVVGEVTTAFSETVPEGKVVSQDPEAGARVEASSTVSFVVSGGEELVEVPDLTGLPQADAIKALRDAGLDLETIQPENSSQIAEGLVIRQVPEGLTKVKPGTRVTIVVSSGTELVRIPDVAGMTKTEAQAKLADLGLDVQVKEEFSSTVSKDRVISQSPGSGVSVDAGAKVTITVSKGPELVEVPDVMEFIEADAVDDIMAAGLVPEIEYQTSPEDGVVLAQWPIAGASVAKGSTVKLTVGKAGP